MTEQQEFEAWWDQDCDTRENPYSQHSMMYWAWEAWKAGRAAENEACAKVCEKAHWSLDDRNEYAAAIRARREQ
jgi:hypothetical protein